MKKLLFLICLIPGVVYSQEMRFKIEEECSTPNASLQFKCRTPESPEFTILKSGIRYTGVNPSSGTTFELKVIKSDRYITVLDNPVFFSGTSTIHITSADNRFYWVEVAYSDILKSREMTVKSGRRIK